MELLPHPLAELFPMLPDAEIALLADDICTNGLNHPIVMYEGKILDGRHRHAACTLGKVQPSFVDYKGSDPLAFVISQNLHRRHLTESQRAMVAARLATWRRGVNQHTARPADLPVWKAAKMFSVSARTIKSAQTVERDGEPEIVAAVRSGTLAVNAAETISKLPRDQQRNALAERRDGRRDKPSSILDSLRVRHGAAIGDVSWSELPALIGENLEEARLLQSIFNHAANVDPSSRVRDIVDAALVQRCLAEKGGSS